MQTLKEKRNQEGEGERNILRIVSLKYMKYFYIDKIIKNEIKDLQRCMKEQMSKNLEKSPNNKQQNQHGTFLNKW